MWIKKQFGLRVLFTIMVFVAHACAKPHFAKQLNKADVEVVATWCPFLISISYHEDGGSTNPRGDSCRSSRKVLAIQQVLLVGLLPFSFHKRIG